MMLVKTDKGTLAPGDRYSQSLVAKLQEGRAVLATVKRMRNPQFHRKFFALAHMAFEQWNPEGKSIAGAPAMKSFERFRKDLVIQAGYYEIVLGIDGEARLEAKSIAFGNMDQAEFEQIYESVVAVLCAGIMPGLTVAEAQRLSDAVFNEGF
jgi:hypothetical protein